MRHYGRFYIGGSWIEPAEDRRMNLVDPTTEEMFAILLLGSAADFHPPANAARAAFHGFSQSTKAERIALCRRIISGLGARINEFSDAIVQELGAPKSVTIHTTGPLQIFEQTIELIQEYEFETTVKGTLIRREAIGVAGLITPWNWPVQSICGKLCSALAAGCTVVLKPSEYASVSAFLLAGSVQCGVW
jgi:aldehyde dehydrogenase (NAD+)